MALTETTVLKRSVTLGAKSRALQTAPGKKKEVVRLHRANQQGTARLLKTRSLEIRPSARAMKSSWASVPLHMGTAWFTFLYFCLITWGMMYRLQTSFFKKKKQNKWGKNCSTVHATKGAESDLSWKLKLVTPDPPVTSVTATDPPATAGVWLLLLVAVVWTQILLSI